MGVRMNVGFTAAVAALAVPAAAAWAAPWEVETVPSHFGQAYGVSLDLDPNGPCTPFCRPTPGDPGQPLIGAVQSDGSVVRHAFAEGRWWGYYADSGIESAPGESSIVVDAGGVDTHLRGHFRLAGTRNHPEETPASTHLIYAPGDLDEFYETQQVDLAPGEGAIGGVSIAVDGAGTASIGYQRRGDGSLQVMLARQDGAGAWQLMPVATAPAASGAALGDTSLEMLPGGGHRLAYELGGEVYVAGKAAIPELLTGAVACAADGDLELELDAAGRPHVAFADTCGTLRHAADGGAGWQLGVVRTGGTITGASVALDPQDRPHFSWVEGGALRHQRAGEAAQVVAPAEARTTAIKVDLDGHAHIAFSRPDGLGHAFNGPPPCFGRRATIVGTAGADSLSGTPGDDVIAALGGNDVIRGAGGDDLVCAGPGDDVASGGVGIDRMDGNGGADQLHGDLGDDHLTGDGGPVTSALGGSDRLIGGDGDDLLEAGDLPPASAAAAADRMEGGAGNDVLFEGPGDDQLDTGPGDDQARAGEGADTVRLGDGADYLDAGGGGDTVEAGDGNDRVFGDLGDDRISGGAGNDWLEGWLGADVLAGEAGDDRLEGGPDGDRLSGGAGNDLLDGGEGEDTCDQGAGTGPSVGCAP